MIFTYFFMLLVQQKNKGLDGESHKSRASLRAHSSKRWILDKVCVSLQPLQLIADNINVKS